MPSNRPRQRRAPNRRPAAPGAGPRAPRPGGTRRPNSPGPQRQPGARAALERVSHPLLVRLTGMPRWLLGLLTAGFLLGGLFAPVPWGPILLSVVVLFLVWLLVLAWPRLDPRARLVRAAVLGALAAVVAGQAAGLL